MSLEELKEEIGKLKLPYLECNLFSPELLPGRYQETGLYVEKAEDVWNVYECERLLRMPKATFYREEDLYEYVFCYYKKISDNKRLF